jgi:hypothetical protein
MSNRVLKRKTLLFASIFAVLAFCLTTFAQDSGGLKGKVRTSSGSGIPNASVSARQDGADVKTVTADNNGNFVISGLAPGKYNVLFDAKGYAAGVLYNVEVKKKGVRDLGDRLILTIDRGTLVIIQGSVFYREGTSLTGAKVECEEVLSDGSTKKLGSTFSSSDGEFTFRMREGASKVRVTASFKGKSGTKEITVGQPAIYRLAISLDVSRTEK